MIVYLDLVEMLKASKYALTLDELRKRLVLRRDAIGKALDAARADYEQTIREGEAELEELNRALTAFVPPPPPDAPVFRTDVGGTPVEGPAPNRAAPTNPITLKVDVDQMAGERLVDATALAKRFEEAVREALEKTLKESR
jgi:hypothetical protein